MKSARCLTLALCGGLLAYGVGVAVPAAGIIGSAQATTSYYTACDNDNLKLQLPKPWKKLLKHACVQGHGSGAYHTEIRVGGYDGYMPLRIDGMDAKNNYSVVKSKTTAKYKGVEYGFLEWTLKNKTGNEGFMNVRNVYRDAWDLAHGEDVGWGITVKSADSVIKIYSHGKMSYSKVAKLSKSKATSAGKKAIKSYTTKYIIPGIQMQ